MPGTYPLYLDSATYVRHRARQVRQSIYEDAKHTLATPRDYAGRLESDVDVALKANGVTPDVYAWLPPSASQLMPLLGEHPLTFIESFPEGGLAAYEKIALNTLALDNGRSEPEYGYELGGLMAQEWAFTFALNASTDAVAQALFQDLNDRLLGRATLPPRQEVLDNLLGGDLPPPPDRSAFVTLYNYAATTPIPITRMEVESFQFAKSEEEAAPGVQLFFGELVITDYLMQGDSTTPE